MNFSKMNPTTELDLIFALLYCHTNDDCYFHWLGLWLDLLYFREGPKPTKDQIPLTTDCFCTDWTFSEGSRFSILKLTESFSTLQNKLEI